MSATQSMVTMHIFELILLPIDKLNPGAPLSDFRMGSMLAAEIRIFIREQLNVNVPFMSFL